MAWPWRSGSTIYHSCRNWHVWTCNSSNTRSSLSPRRFCRCWLAVSSTWAQRHSTHLHSCLCATSIIDRGRYWLCIANRRATLRSEEHTSELQSQSNLACRLLLEKKNDNLTYIAVALSAYFPFTFNTVAFKGFDIAFKLLNKVSEDLETAPVGIAELILVLVHRW